MIQDMRNRLITFRQWPGRLWKLVLGTSGLRIGILEFAFDHGLNRPWLLASSSVGLRPVSSRSAPLPRSAHAQYPTGVLAWFFLNHVLKPHAICSSGTGAAAAA